MRRTLQKLARKFGWAKDPAIGASAAAVTAMVGGLEGAVLGGTAAPIAGQLWKKLGAGFSANYAGPQGALRVGKVLALSAHEIRMRRDQGDQLREDGFFNAGSGARSDAEEVVESILLKVEREAEEKKLPYMAHLIASLAFDSTIDSEMAHQISKTAEELTYRQLCLLRLPAVRNTFQLRESDYRGQGSIDRRLAPVLYECLGLYDRGFLNFGGEVLFGPTGCLA